MADIFLSYRRQDSQSATGRLADELSDYFGAARVFRDHDSIVAGEDFAEAIRRAIGNSVVVLVVIGPHWVDAAGADGTRRLDEALDFVRLEIEAALDANVPLIPLLVEGAVMPPASSLPASLQAFSRCQAMELSDMRWRYDVGCVIDTLQKRFAIESEQTPKDALLDRHTTLGALARIALDLLELATHPTRLIARRQTGYALDHVQAFVFLLACIVLGNLGLVISVGLKPALSWLSVGLLAGLVIVTLLAVPLTLAWRLVGVRVEFRQITLILAYIYGGAWIGLCGGVLFMTLGVQLVEPGIFERYFALMKSDVALEQRLAQSRVLFESAMQGWALRLGIVGFLVWIVTAIWAAVAWTAFRISFGVSRLKSFLASAIWLAIIGGLALAVSSVGLN